MPEAIKTKQCCACKEIKPISKFYADKRSKDGLQGACRECQISAVRKYQKTEKGILNVRFQSQTEKRKVSNGRFRRTEKGKAILNRYRARNPEVYKAQKAVNHEVEAARMPRISTLRCSCGEQAEQYHHHKGYDRKHWLDVIPKCVKCHKKIHITKSLSIYA